MCVFLTSRERYVPSAEPATRRLSSGRCPKSNPSSVSHNPRRAVMGHPSTSYSAAQVQRERKGQKGMFIIPPEYDDTQSRAVVTQWTSSGPVVFSVLQELTPDFPGSPPQFQLAQLCLFCCTCQGSCRTFFLKWGGPAETAFETTAFTSGSICWRWNHLGGIITFRPSSI